MPRRERHTKTLGDSLTALFAEVAEIAGGRLQPT
jgi:hypothetical protein